MIGTSWGSKIYSSRQGVRQTVSLDELKQRDTDSERQKQGSKEWDKFTVSGQILSAINFTIKLF